MKNIPMTYIVAELSANHNGSLDRAKRTIKTAAEAGADAVKLQTYTADTLTIDCDNEYFTIGGGTSWDGRNLYDLYKEAYTPWEWHTELKREAESLGLDFFSTPFDATAVDFLEELGVECYKVASFEIVDIPLLKKIGGTGKPVIMSTGMASADEIEEAIGTLRAAGSAEITLLKCTSSYPADAADANLLTIPDMAKRFDCPVGLSDHSMDIAVPVAAAALGACMIEKHLTLSRDAGGPDSSFSLEPQEFKAMVDAVRVTEKALGGIRYGGTESEEKSKVFRRSLFVVKDIKKGETFTEENLRSIRPGYGMHTRYINDIIGCKAAEDIKMGTPLKADLVVGWLKDHDGVDGVGDKFNH